MVPYAKNAYAVLAAFMLSGVMAGCAADSAQQSGPPNPPTVSEQPSSTASTAASPSVAAAPSVAQSSSAQPSLISTTFLDVSGSLDLKNPDGYTYTLDYQASSDGFTQDPANAKPGFTDVLLDTSFSATATNTTPNRNSPGDEIMFNVWGLYPSSSVVCKMKQTPRSDFYVTQRTWISSDEKPRYCGVQLSRDLGNYGTSIAADESMELQAQMLIGPSQSIEGVPEDEVYEIIDELEKPKFRMALITEGNVNQISDATSSLKYEGSCTLTLIQNEGQTNTKITGIPLDADKGICK